MNRVKVESMEQFETLIDEGYTVSYILDESGISRSTLYNELRKRGQ